jgi:hypothetical protein
MVLARYYLAPSFCDQSYHSLDMIGMGKHIPCLRLNLVDQPQKLFLSDEHQRNLYHFYHNFDGEKDRAPVIGGEWYEKA